MEQNNTFDFKETALLKGVTGVTQRILKRLSCYSHDLKVNSDIHRILKSALGDTHRIFCLEVEKHISSESKQSLHVCWKRKYTK